MAKVSFAQPVQPLGPITDIILDERTIYDLEMLLIGSFAPLEGFCNLADFCSIVTSCKLESGIVWPLPVILPFSHSHCENNENVTSTNQRGSVIQLRDVMNLILAELIVDDFYKITDLNLVCKHILGSSDMNHPYSRYLHSLENPIFVGGKIRRIHDISRYDFIDLRLTPAQVRQEAQKKKWSLIAGFQTRNPMHRSHVILTIKAMEKISKENGGARVTLLISPVCGVTQQDDIPYHIRVRCYKKVLPYYQEYAKSLSFIGDVKLVLIPLSMRMAGPREALLHALIRKNYGCTHFIVGRDHAGPSVLKKDMSKFYRDYEAHVFLEQYQGLIDIKPVLGKNIQRVVPLNDSIAEPDENDLSQYIEEDNVDPRAMRVSTISGTQLREALQRRSSIPHWYSFPEVVQVLQQHYRPYHELGFCIYFTGLPCSGKTTLASAVQAILVENDAEKRHVTFLDADIIRTHLSKGLGFDRESRKLHVQRIGYVCSLIVQSGGICVVANIAPYAADRQDNRSKITSTGGGYVEVYVSTPLEICEHRDVKGQYKKARLGIVPRFTGISDPYEAPTNPELTIDSSENLYEKAMIVVDYLKQQKWVL